MNSDDIFAMEELPQSMVVIGGGYIGIELAQILQAFGVKVTLLVRSVPLKFVDEDIREVLLENMRKLGVDVRLETPHESITKNWNGSLNVNLKNGETINAEECLLAVGRPPNLKGLGLDKTQIVTDNGAIKVNEF